ncbi:MAG: alpha-glucan family phosphorylase [Bacteroidetes bacterium]|nr:alpha-glucan family phosphorylase [Bacteroidota bacterium]
MFNLDNLFPYEFDEPYHKPVAYFSMEFAIDQSLKTYSGGLGFLAGSHMRSAFNLRQNLVGIGILWKYGYYDQDRARDGSMKVNYVQKDYYFLEETGIRFTISIHRHPVHVKVWLLRPEVFGTAPVFFLSTDIPENDFLAQTICHRLYDHHESARIAQSILLGKGGAKLLDELGRKTEVYHLNEGHALPLCFYLLKKFHGKLEEVKNRVVFTTHTPEPAGNEVHDVASLDVLGFFQDASSETIQSLSEDGHNFNYTLAALRMCKKANGVSRMHGEVSRAMWKNFEGTSSITEITNAQSKKFWMDLQMEKALVAGDTQALARRKKEMKAELFSLVADQTGRKFNVDVLTIVWARRFAAYKRADLILRDIEKLRTLLSNQDYPIQIIWAGKPYPEDQASIDLFNSIFYRLKEFSNAAVLTGYEIRLSGLLKKGSDVWLNNPRLFREASGTSGMTAAMNGSINLSIADGWIPEFARHGKNSYLIPHAPTALTPEEKDHTESVNLYRVLEEEVMPAYYRNPSAWQKIMVQSMKDVMVTFDSDRMAAEYYQKMYE